MSNHPDLSDRAVHVYAALARHANQDGRCWPGRERLATVAGCSVRSVDRALVELDDAGVIERTARGNGSGGQSSTLYALNAAGKGGGFAAVPERALDLSPRAVRLYARVDLMADRKGIASPSRRRLADLLDCSTDSIDRAMTQLLATGLVERLAIAGKTGRFRLPHRPTRPAGACGQPADVAPAPSARVTVRVPHGWQGNEKFSEREHDDTRSNSKTAEIKEAAAPLSSGSSAPSATRAMTAWKWATCRAYAATVAAGRTDLTNPPAFTATVARQALDERADRLAELQAAGLDPAAAAAALTADGPAPPPPAPPRRESRPLGDAACPVCEGGGWALDLHEHAIRCACLDPTPKSAPPRPPASPILDPDETALNRDETALNRDEALARLRAIRCTAPSERPLNSPSEACVTVVSSAQLGFRPD